MHRLVHRELNHRITELKAHKKKIPSKPISDFFHPLSCSAIKLSSEPELSGCVPPPWLQLTQRRIDQVKEHHLSHSTGCLIIQVPSALETKALCRPIVFMYANPGLKRYRLQTALEMINGRLKRLYNYAVHEQDLIKNELLVRRYCVWPKCHSCKDIATHYQLSCINHVDTIVRGVIRVTLNSDQLTQSFHRTYFKLFQFFVLFWILRVFLRRAVLSHGSEPKISVLSQKIPQYSAQILLFQKNVHIQKHIFEFQASLAVSPNRKGLIWLLGVKNQNCLVASSPIPMALGQENMT